MTARRWILGVMLAGCGESGGSAATGFHNVPTAASVADVAFGPDSTAYVMTGAGVLRYDGSAFVPFGPAGAASVPFRVEADGTMFGGAYRAKPGATAWELIELPGASADRGGATQIMMATDGSTYALGAIADPLLQQLYRQVGDGSWTPVGAPTAFSERMYADEDGGVWFETGWKELYVARDGELTYVFRSSGLGMVADELYYFGDGSPADDAMFTPILAVAEDGEEHMVSRGRCVDAALPCPGASGLRLAGQRAANGWFYESWQVENGYTGPNPVVLALPAGETDWRAVADLSFGGSVEGPGQSVIAPRPYVAPDGTIWATMDGLMFRIDD